MTGALASATFWDLSVIAALIAAAVAYTAGVTRVWQRLGFGRGFRVWEAAAFAIGWFSLLAALNRQVHDLAARSFAVHMTQHELLMLVAAPLVILGRPVVAILQLMPAAARPVLRTVRQGPLRAVWTRITAPVAVLLLHGVLIWIWHVPVLFEAALAHEGIHATQHLTFFWTAALFWWALIHGRYGRLGYGISVLFVFVTAMHTSLLGALLTFAPRVWYAPYAHRATVHGSALEDQQLAGLLMWIPSGTIFLVCGLALFGAWLGEASRRSPVRVHRIP